MAPELIVTGTSQEGEVDECSRDPKPNGQDLATIDPTPYFQKYGPKMSAAVRGYMDAVTEAAAEPGMAKYTGVLAAAHVFTTHTTQWVLDLIRLDRGVSIQVHT